MSRLKKWLFTSAVLAGSAGSFLGLSDRLDAQSGVARLTFQERPVEETPAAETPSVLPSPVVTGEPQPAAPAAKKEEPKSFWEKVPPIHPMPPVGFFPVPPTGPGYYSLFDALHGEWRAKPPQSGYPRTALIFYPLYDADFRYLDAPKYAGNDPFDRLHRVHLGEDWLFSTGGEVRYRYNDEKNSRLTGRNNTYDLFRARVFGDLWYRDSFRVFAELFTAQTFNQDLPPLAIDRNYADFLNLFVEVKLFDPPCGEPVYARVGRQQMLLGSQRLVSPLDWANSPRTFQGVRVYRQSEKFDLDAFWMQPVVPDADDFDSVDNNQNFAGLWGTYRPKKGQNVDLYYLFLDNANHPDPRRRPPAVGPLNPPPYNVHTLGTRYVGKKDNFLWDAELMLQLGEHTDRNLVAGATATGAGYHFKEAPLNPTVWAYYDWASGSNRFQGGPFGTFNQLYPFGHYYMGWLDLVARQNIQDVNFHLYLYPTKWITFNTQYHIFHLANARDALYGPAGAPLRFDPTGRAGRDVGQELDLIMNFHVGTHQDILVAYSHMWAGRFLERTGPGRDPETFWLMYNFRW